MFPIASADELSAIEEQIQAKQAEWEQADLAVQNNMIETVSTSGNGLLAEIYDNRGYNASPPLPGDDRKVYETHVPNIDFQWYSGTILGTGAEDIAVKFTGTITTTTDKSVTFYAPGDDGVKLYIDGELVINDWVDKGGGGSLSREIAFEANTPKQITLWFYENGGGANVWLYWDNEIVPREAFMTTTVERSINPELLAIANALYAELQVLIDQRDAILSATPTPTPTPEPTPEPVIIPEPTPIPEPVYIPPTPVVVEPIQPVISVPEVVVEPTLPVNVEPEPEPEPEPIVEPEPEPEIVVEEPEPTPIPEVEEPEPSPEPTPEVVIEEPEIVVEPEVVIEEPEPIPIIITEPSTPTPQPTVTEVPIGQQLVEQMQVDIDLSPTAVADSAVEAATATAEFVKDIFTNPAKALETLSAIGSSMTEEEREVARQVVVPVILVNNIISAVGVSIVRRF